MFKTCLFFCFINVFLPHMLISSGINLYDTSHLNWLVPHTWRLAVWMMLTAGIDGHYWYITLSHRTPHIQCDLFYLYVMRWSSANLTGCFIFSLLPVAMSCRYPSLIYLLPPQYNESQWTYICGSHSYGNMTAIQKAIPPLLWIIHKA